MIYLRPDQIHMFKRKNSALVVFEKYVDLIMGVFGCKDYKYH